MLGQLTIFDSQTDTRPCRYKFPRYERQRVSVLTDRADGKVEHFTIEHGTIKEIVNEYYTLVKLDSGREVLASPPDLAPEGE